MRNFGEPQVSQTIADPDCSHDYISVRPDLICATLMGLPHTKHLHLGYRFNLSVFNRWIRIIQGLVTGESICCFLTEGKIGGTSRMQSHISVHRGTIKFRSNSFVFKIEIGKEGLPSDITPALGAGGLEFKSWRPTTLCFNATSSRS